MARKICVVSQKGGVAKSSLSRTIAVEFSRSGWEVLIADMDVKQSTSTDWNATRMSREITPDVSVQGFNSVERVLRIEKQYQLIVFDGAPHSSQQTLEMAKVCDLILLPTGISLDDMNPQIRLAHEMVKSGIGRDKFVFLFVRTGASEKELLKAREYLSATGYGVLSGHIPEKDSYRMALDEGKCLSETLFKSLNERVDVVIEEVVKHLIK